MFKESKQGKGNVHTPTYTYALTDVAGNTGNIRFVANIRERRACEAAFTKREFHIRFFICFSCQQRYIFFVTSPGFSLFLASPEQNPVTSNKTNLHHYPAHRRQDSAFCLSLHIR